jgi:glycine betaine/proline transport system permease protein
MSGTEESLRLRSANGVGGPVAAWVLKLWRTGGARVLLAGLMALAAGFAVPGLDRYPEALVIPVKDVISAVFTWLGEDLSFGLFTFREVTRGFAALLGYPLNALESLLFDGGGAIPLLPLPWIAVVGLAAVIGHSAGGWRTGLLAAGCFGYMAVFNLWAPAMETFALVAGTVPVVVAVGVLLGIAGWRDRRVEAGLTPLFDVMQSMPAFAYLVPVMVLFGFGQVPGLIATAVFAVPPTARCVMHGLKQVPGDVVEAGWMAGCTPRQQLWRVLIPTARPSIMVGVNQAIMQTLAMVVIASLIGASGLGNELLTALQRLKLGVALEQGVAISLMAVALDRVSRAYVYKPIQRKRPDLPPWRRHPHVTAGAGLVVASLAAAEIVPFLRQLPETMTVDTAPFWSGLIDAVVANFYDDLRAFKWVAVLWVLIPVKETLQALPWVVFPTVFGVLGYHLGGARLGAVVAALIAFPALTGYWEPAVNTAYMITIAVVICILIGLPIGIVGSQGPRRQRVVIGLCDLMQTFPSFVYLLPVVMLFKVGDLAGILAVIAFATVPMIRYTNLGLRGIHPNVIEAARAAGCRSWQMFLRVKLPAALPTLMLGVNQVIFMALFMVAITALIGTNGLGQEINKARSDVNTGAALTAGLSIAFMGMVADRLIKAWVARREARFGKAAA